MLVHLPTNIFSFSVCSHYILYKLQLWKNKPLFFCLFHDVKHHLQDASGKLSAAASQTSLTNWNDFYMKWHCFCCSPSARLQPSERPGLQSSQIPLPTCLNVIHDLHGKQEGQRSKRPPESPCHCECATTQSLDVDLFNFIKPVSICSWSQNIIFLSTPLSVFWELFRTNRLFLSTCDATLPL